ncbi:peptidase dimerization domain-containing protein [Streptomyces sp. NPDC007162]|uniref:peptidase dimerization domain-containing protein n=1 Tax=Streptomyces sp. NPDC007162 TaxID=3156917 RepID=UPI0033C07329
MTDSRHDQAVSEVGGFSVSLDPTRRVYLVESGRKGVAWLRLMARGVSGHGSLTYGRTAVGELAAAVARITEHDWPLTLTPTSAGTITDLSALSGLDLAADGSELAGTVLAPVAGLLTSSLRHVANPTVLRAGGPLNVVPGEAEALLDGRFVPGFGEDFLSEIARLAGPAVDIEVIDLTAADESDPRHLIVDAMHRSLREEDPGHSSCPTAPRPPPTTPPSHPSASPVTGSPHSSCRPASTSPPCSTVSTNAFRWSP